MDLGDYGSITRPVRNSTKMRPFSPDAHFKLEGTSWKRVEYLGKGAFATVHEAITNRQVRFAVKEVRLLDENGRMQLQREIEIYRQHEHENIVRYLGTDQDGKKLYLFLELMPGGSLETLYKERRLMDSDVSSITRQILNVLVFLHDRNVIHRDIKCANILVGERGSVKLADFGLAKDTNLDAAISLVGTPLYMAPEVVGNEVRVSYGAPADIWSLACTVLEMLTRKPPYPDSIEARVFLKLTRGEFPEVPKYLSENAQNFISKCLRVNPIDRPTARELLEYPFVN